MLINIYYSRTRDKLTNRISFMQSLLCSYICMLCSSYEYEDFLFVMRSCSKLLFVNYILSKSFFRKTIIKFSSCLYCLAKKCSFSQFVQQKNLRVRVCKNWKQQNPRVCVFKKMCTGKKIFVFVVQRKRKIFAMNLRVRNFLALSYL